MKDKRVFEFDKNKSQINKEKHGISFDEAKLLWKDKNSLIVPAKTIEGEDRFALIGRLNSKCYVAIFTLRNKSYRIISVRRCRKNEEKIMITTNDKAITIREFDKKFDSGEDVSEYLDFSKAQSLEEFEKERFKVRKVNVDFPEYIINLLDKEAQKIGVTRQSIIKVWIAERLKEEQKFSLNA